jgi:hypothetical protein
MLEGAPEGQLVSLPLDQQQLTFDSIVIQSEEEEPGQETAVGDVLKLEKPVGRGPYPCTRYVTTASHAPTSPLVLLYDTGCIPVSDVNLLYLLYPFDNMQLLPNSGFCRCGQEFDSWAACKRHVKGHQLDRSENLVNLYVIPKTCRRYRCNECSATYNLERNLVLHMAGHQVGGRSHEIDIDIVAILSRAEGGEV